MVWRMVRRTYFLLSLSQDVVLLIVAAIMLLELYEAGWTWGVAAGLLIALGILYHRWPNRLYHLYLAAETALVVGLTTLDTIAMVLCFTLSAHAAILFPNRTGALWIALLILATGAVNVYRQGWLSGLLETLVYAVGYVSFGFVHYARERAEAARHESQTLLAELQEAHRQLQAYADRVEELAVAEERNRLAREMHDTLGHRLTVAAVQLEGAQRLIPHDPQRAAHMVGTVRDQVREALSELRRTVAALRTPLAADLPLPTALARLATGFEEATGLTVHLTLPQKMPALPDTHRLALYRAAQEALTNVQRHAQARDVWLQLARQGETVTLTVGDNGVGTAVDAERAGFGLRGMQERAVQLGGELALESRPDGGAQLFLRLPLPTEGTDG
jgi:signal transduction histidine kinase